jgi:hypothetical protein
MAARIVVAVKQMQRGRFVPGQHLNDHSYGGDVDRALREAPDIAKAKGRRQADVGVFKNGNLVTA